MEGLLLDGRRCDGKRGKNAWSRDELINAGIKEGLNINDLKTLSMTTICVKILNKRTEKQLEIVNQLCKKV